jgi:hypothetical protein
VFHAWRALTNAGIEGLLVGGPGSTRFGRLLNAIAAGCCQTKILVKGFPWVSVGNRGGAAAGGERGTACKGDGGVVLNCCDE